MTYIAMRKTDPDPFSPDIINDAYYGLLDAEQFSQADVLSVTGLSAGQLKGILDRKQISLRSQHNPGTGRRRMFCGDDIIRLATAYHASRIGFPLRWVQVLADQVGTRMNWLRAVAVTGGDTESPVAFALFPQGDDEDWANVAVVAGKPSHPLPIACIYFQVDRLLEEVTDKLEALIEDKPLPDHSIPEVKVEDPYSKDVNFFLDWDKDDEGRDIRTGLTLEESLDLERLRKAWLDDRMTDGPRTLTRDDRSRLTFLSEKHERARLQRVGAKIAGEQEEGTS